MIRHLWTCLFAATTHRERRQYRDALTWADAHLNRQARIWRHCQF